MTTSQRSHVRLEDRKTQRLIERIANQKTQSTVDEIRCPYCVERDNFKVLTPRDAQLICMKCGHVVVLDRVDYKCHCRKCRSLLAVRLSPRRRWLGLSATFQSAEPQKAKKVPSSKRRLAKIPNFTYGRRESYNSQTAEHRRTCDEIILAIRNWTFGIALDRGRST